MKLDFTALDPAPTAVVANLPYSVATPVILRTIEQLPSVGAWTVMVQREIADRLRAAPGSRTYGSPSVVAQIACEVELVRTVDPAVFKPRPRVESAILRLRRIGPGAGPDDPRPRPRRLRPPPQVPGSLPGARPRRLPSAPPARHWPSWACREDARAEALSRRGFRGAFARSCSRLRLTPARPRC